MLAPTNSRPKTLDELRSRIDEADREILSFCWSLYREHGQHPKLRDIYFKFEKPIVDEAAKRLSGNLIRRVWSSDTLGEDCRVTHLGALVSDDGIRLTGLLEQFLEALKLLYDANHDTRGIVSKDLKPYLDRACRRDFPDDDLRDLGRLLVLGVRLLDTGASGPNQDGTWYVNIGEDVDNIRRISDFKTFLQEELVKSFDPEGPVAEIERSTRQLQFNRPPFWPGAGEPTPSSAVDPERKTPFARLVDALRNHPVVSFVLLMLPVAGGSFAVANLLYSSVISEYRQKMDEMSAEIAKLQREIVDLRRQQTPSADKPHATKN